LLAQEAVGESLVFAHQAEQEMLCFNVRAAVLAGFVPCKEDDAARFFRIAFKHD
jgi:hypothetical protein